MPLIHEFFSDIVMPCGFERLPLFPCNTLCNVRSATYLCQRLCHPWVTVKGIVWTRKQQGVRWIAPRFLDVVVLECLVTVMAVPVTIRHHRPARK